MNLGIHIRERKIGRAPVMLPSGRRVARWAAVIGAALLLAPPAWAQLSQVNTLLSTIQTTLLGVGGVICSISIIWAGFRMMFQHARFGDIANVFIGGLFVGCATVIAGMLIPTS
ncbi:TrbC/VirB2 family protein [Paraburkholderia phenoliruptrix]|uniref:TrbC/VirB2 family protein n=1 Tax=Paraburkholderia phenoliruptrix TaxID=252970 RepID=UPI002869B46B|nr:TrbC/VirB2 family protein [Paraburkholderia phenoliruptrix]WMY09528.1 TrbC/VirB2 family protein [Paraburkholderia phenoliruptrix]